MKILITGAGGFLGHALCARLASSGHSILGLDLFPSDAQQFIRELRRKELRQFPIRWLQTDLKDPENWKSQVRDFAPEILIHLAAQSGIRACEENPEECLQTNIQVFQNLLNFASEFPVKKIVLASSSSIYGRQPHRPFSEGDALGEPISVYGRSKWENECQLKEWVQLDPCRTGIALRFFTVFGPLGRPDMAVWRWMEALYSQSPFCLNGSEILRDFTYADDAVSALEAAALYPTPGFYALNIGSGTSRTIRSAGEDLSKVAGRTCIVQSHPFNPSDMPYTCADISAAQALLGWTPLTNWESALQKTWDWFESAKKRKEI